ncbi:MAG: hypothetical protein WAW96_16525 [Alphaproteobacteria bacterium]
MQPAQLSLLPDQVPAAPPPSTPQLPEAQLAAAVTLLAGLIAKAATPNPIGTQVSRDE